jgi:hypothetical protein
MREGQATVGTLETGEGGEAFVYREPAVVEALSLVEVEAIWDLVPTEDRDYLLRRYRRSLKQHGIASDEAEIQLADAYLQRYQYEGLVPAGEQWVRISASRRQQLKRGETDSADPDDDEGRSIPWLGLAVVVFGVFLLLFVVPRLLNRRSVDIVAQADVTATATSSPTPTASAVPTITPTPTATPIALVESDTFISAGDGRNRNFFPVQLQIRRPDEAQPRVFIVQERVIQLTEWSFDPNPDVASWISGTLVRPVLGIPFSEENEALMTALGEGADFVLRMNTGVELRYRFTAGTDVGREDTARFRQDEPGIVLVLIGERGADDLPTASRRIVTGTYDPGTEVDVTGFTALPAAIGEAVQLPDLALTVDDGYVLPLTDGGSEDVRLAVLDVTLIGGEQAVPLSAYQWFLDTDEARYAPDLSQTNGLRHNILPPILEAGQTLPASIPFLVGHVAGDALFLVAPPGLPAAAFRVSLQQPAPVVSVEQLHVQLRRVRRGTDQVYADLRLYNPQVEAVTLAGVDIHMIFGFTPMPTGPRVPPLAFEDLTLEPEAAWDVTLTFAWNGDDPYASLHLAGHVWSITLIE